MPLSNKDSLQRNVLRWAGIIFLVEIAIVVLLLPPRVVKELIDRERALYADELGRDAEDNIRRQADRMFKFIAIDTGFRDNTYRFMIGQFDQGDEQSTIKLNDRGVRDWEIRQLKSIWGATYLALYRWAAIIAWLPFILPIAAAAVFDGWTRWRIGQWQFSFASPVRHGSALHVISVLVVIALCLPIVPIAVTAYCAPTLLFIAVLAAWVAVSNLSKRF